MPSLEAGAVVWIECEDPNGKNRKQRPAVVITAAVDIVAGGPIVAVAITTNLPNPLPDTHVLLPWSHRRHPRTSLTEPCAAHCAWIVPVPSDAEKAGYVSGKLLRAITDKVAALAKMPRQ